MTQTRDAQQVFARAMQWPLALSEEMPKALKSPDFTAWWETPHSEKQDSRNRHLRSGQAGVQAQLRLRLSRRLGGRIPSGRRAPVTGWESPARVDTRRGDGWSAPGGRGKSLMVEIAIRALVRTRMVMSICDRR